MRANLINGQTLQFGNIDHINWVKRNCAIMLGQESISTVDWEFVRLLNKTSETGKPLTQYVWKVDKADAVQSYVECPRCGKYHKHVVGFDPTEPMTEQMLLIEGQEILCWYCGLEMYINDENEFCVRVPQNDC